ncbi:MAG: SapC family protein [Sphingomicrobium sp.]
MATAAPNQSLPLFYTALEPLNATQHGKMNIRRLEKAPMIGATHAFPVTVDEFGLLQRSYPIVFSLGDNPIPLALMGLNEGTNVFLDENGLPRDPDLYIPAYLRRYPFLLARIRPDSDELSLCFDPASGAIGAFEEGEALFDGDGQPSQATKAILQFCEQFETAGQRTAAFMEELAKSGLLMDGEVAIQPQGAEQPFVYRGFQMVDEEKMRELRGDELRKMNQNGMLALVFAHLFSLSQIRDVFARQVAQGKGPIPAQQAQAETAAAEPAEA